MRPSIARAWFKLTCFVTLAGVWGCDYVPVVTPASPVPFQPLNPYFYNLQLPFDMVRAWIDALIHPIFV